MERVAGIEPAPSAWKAEVLPLNYTRGYYTPGHPGTPRGHPPGPPIPRVVEGVGFEPTKAEPSDLQSGPFGHSGTPPGIQHKRREIVRFRASRVNAANARGNRAPTSVRKPPETARNAHRPRVRDPGAATRNRTLDLLITSELLYRLSYGGRPTSSGLEDGGDSSGWGMGRQRGRRSPGSAAPRLSRAIRRTPPGDRGALHRATATPAPSIPGTGPQGACPAAPEPVPPTTRYTVFARSRAICLAG